MAVQALWSSLLLLSLALLLCPGVESDDKKVLSCRRNCSYPEVNVNLSLIQGVWDSLEFERHDLYEISLCGPYITTEGCVNASVCVNMSTSGRTYTLGTQDTCRVEFNPTSKSLLFSFKYENVRPFRNSYVNVSLICGSRAGVPLVVNKAPIFVQDEGGALIEWVSRATCNTASPYRDSASAENKCYAVKNTWKATSGIPADIYDLSPLITNKLNGYQVDTPDYPEIDMRINPCYPINSPSSSCNGSVACKLESGVYKAVSSFSSEARVEIKNNQLQLHYPLNRTQKAALNCTGSSGLTINFNCPVGDLSTVPTLVYVSGDHCYYEVVWNTDHACGRSRISNESCDLTFADGTSFNLTGDSQIMAEQNVNGTEDGVTYYLRICSDNDRVDVEKCPNKQARVAQVTDNNEKCYMIGGDRQTLSYADGVLSLLVEGGDPCSDHFRRSTLITFVCDKDAEGTSTDMISYQGETNHCFYSFEWVTPAACRPERTASDCRLTTNVTGEIYEYDFAQLAVVEENHIVSGSEDNVTCIQVNLCGQLKVREHGTSEDNCNHKHVPVSCANASVCVLFNNGMAFPWGTFDAGNASQVAHASNLILTLKTVDGPPCTGKRGRVTVIDFVCRPGTLGLHPQYVAMDDDCTYKLEWQTAYACPLSTVVGGSDCQVEDPKTGSLFNLKGLKRDSYYSFSTSEYEYQINFCGSAVGTDCEGDHIGMCQVKTGATSVAGKSNTTLEYDGGVLRAIYPGGDKCNQSQPRSTTIIFECNPEANEPTIVSIKEDSHCQYVVTVQTAEACPIEFRGMDCTYTSDSQDKYDLTSLIKHSDQNWEASTPTEVFVINVCRPLNTPSGGCTSASSVCSYSVGEGEGKTFEKSLGRPSTGKLSMNKDKHLQLSYTCTDTSNTGSCGTSISFICDKKVAVTNGPTFEFMLDGLYHFTWRTPYACPVNKDEEQLSSSSCVITDPLTNDVINFTTLRKEQDLTVFYANNQGKFKVNVCGPLVSSVDGCSKDAVVCQITPEGIKHSTGSSSKGTLSRHQDGTAELVYKGGDSCNSGPVRKTVFLFVCPEQTTADPPPPYYVNETECTYNFVWPTRLACLPKRMECTAGEDKYDLRTLAESNTKVDLHRVEGNSSLVISLCGPVNLTSDSSLSRCPFGTAACWYNNSAAISLGEVDRGFAPFSDFIDGLELRYIGGSPCHTGGPPSQLLITLVCSEGAEGIPELSPPDWTSCNFRVRWTTRFACSHQTVNKNCSVQDPYTGQSFNFADVLKNTTELSASGQDNKYNYTVSICGEGVNCSSRTDVAGCQGQPTNPNFVHITGLLSNVTVRNQGWGEWLLSFGGGDVCNHNGKKRKTIIHVECDSSLSAGSPNLLSLGEDECEYYFRLLFYDESLCHEVHPSQSCALENYDILALSARGNMEAAGLWNGDKLFLSICQPLNLSSPGVRDCTAGAGACVIPRNRQGITSYFPNGSPEVLSGGRGLTFSYKGDKNAVITLEVRCDRSTEYSTPIISHINGQSYNIYLRTRYGCSSDLLKLSVGPSDNVCSISNPYNSQTYDLSKVFSSTNFSVYGTDGSTLYFDICGATLEECEGGNVAVCSKQKSGAATPIAGRSHTIAIASDEALEVDFVDRRACIGAPGRTYSSVRVTLVCSPHGNSTPVLQPVAKGECAVGIFVPTPVLCSQTSPCEVTASNGSYYDLTALMSTVWEGPVQDSADHFVMGVCRTLGPTNAAKHHCPPTTGICLNGKNLGHMTGSPHIVSDGHVALEYTGGGVCSLTANYSTTVTLICSDSGLLDKPMLTRSPSNNCSYEVAFVTPDACKINQVKQKDSVTKDNCIFTGAEGIELNFNQLPKSVPFLGSLSVNFTIARCDSATVTNSSDSTVLHFNAAKSTAQRNTAVMVFDIKEKKRDTTACSDTVNVQMICNQSDTSDDGNRYYDGVSACVYSLHWYTRFACTASQVACHYHDGSSAFELSPLRSERSHKVRDASTGDTYYINICSPLRGSGVPPDCAEDSAVCVKRSDGTVQDLASIATQKLLLSADKKYVMVQFTLRRGGCSVLILMECAAVFQNPTFTEKRSTSCYLFSWRTPYGCREKPQGPVNCSCKAQECPVQPPPSSVELSYTSFNIAQIKLGSFTFSTPNSTQYFFSICETCDTETCEDSNPGGTKKLPVKVVQFVLEDNYLSIELEGSDDKSLKVTVSLSCLNVSTTTTDATTTTELLFVSETNNHYLLTGSTSFCKRNVVLPASEAPGTHSTPPPPATSSQASIAVVAVAVSIIVAIVIGGCLFVLCKNKQRRYVMKGAFFRLFAVKYNGPVKYRALSQEDKEETAVLLAMDRRGDGDSDTDSEKSDSEPKGDKRAVNPKLDDPGHELVTDDEMLEL